MGEGDESNASDWTYTTASDLMYRAKSHTAGKGQDDPEFWAESVWGLKEWLWELCG